MPKPTNLGALELASLAHDLKTPLTAIRGAAEVLTYFPSGMKSATKAELLSTIVDEADRLIQVTNRLLYSLKLASSSLTFDKSEVQVADVVRKVVGHTARLAPGRVVDVELSSYLPVVDGDAIFLEQALFNLIDNALKYSDSDTLVSVRGWHACERIFVQVLDQGEGIPPWALDRIFEYFYRVHPLDKARSGVGLGLPISRGMVEAMEGTVTVKNRDNQREAVFTITVPAAAACKLEAPVYALVGSASV